MLEQAAGGAVGRPHVARAMIAEGWAVDFRDAFDRYLGNGRPAYVSKERLAVVDAIALIHRAGGLAVLAHPSHTGTRERDRDLRQPGDRRRRGSPSESLCRGHGAADGARRAFSLVPSGGSDWHGAAEGPRTLGMMRVPADWLSRQESRVRVRAALESS